MLFTDFVSWWYGAGWSGQFNSWRERLKHWMQYFSFGMLFTTLFSPWRQIVTIKPPDSSLDQILKAMLDNVISRLVGFWVRSFVIFAGLVVVLVVFIIAIVAMIVWPLLPIAPLLVIALGVSA